MVGRVLWKNEGCAGDAGTDGGKTPTLASLESRYAMEGMLSVHG